MWRREVREEFQLVNFRLLYLNSGDFAESPWFPVTLTVLYRFVIALFLTGWLLYSIIVPAHGDAKWFIFLSNWYFLALTIYFICATVISAWHYKEECKQGEYDVSTHEPIQWSKPSPRSREKNGCENTRDTPRDEERAAQAQINPLDIQLETPMKWYHEAMWVLYNIAANSSLVLTVLYYSTLRPAQQSDALEITVHALNSVFVVIETMLGMFPVRVVHVVHSMLFSVVYIIFTFVYWAFHGTNLQGESFIYQHLDYTESPGRAVGFLLGLLFIGHPLSQVVLCLLYRLRFWLCTRYSDKLGPV